MEISAKEYQAFKNAIGLVLTENPREIKFNRWGQVSQVVMGEIRFKISRPAIFTEWLNKVRTMKIKDMKTFGIPKMPKGLCFSPKSI